ncbi:hypothetical protein [Mesorhizobium sp.]|uniref:hypothetical protein n=1 Tax=Mesorhizobium sp. TaxID=1871066 RepID=UPI0025ED5F6F|nr:hypothetical protein [Mesorhizobium sp.]
MSRYQFVHELESTADHIADASRADLQVMLRRAALMIRNAGGLSLDPRTDDALSSLAAEIGKAKPDLVKTIVGEWLVANAYLPVPYALDEESAVEGNS